MDEFTVKHERLARVATAVVVAIVWALCAFVAFTASEADDTVLNRTDQGGISGTLGAKESINSYLIEAEKLSHG